MSKDAYYFSHDANAFHDPKIIRLRAEFGLEGYGFYWAIIEMMRNQSDYCLHSEELELLPFHLHVDPSKIKQMLSKCYDIDLLQKNGDKVYSDSLLRRMEKADLIRERRRKAGAKGGKAKANAKQNSSKNVALKESKGKESKEEENNNSFSWIDKADQVYLDFCEKYYDMLLKHGRVKKNVNWKTKTWYDAARLIVERDGEDIDKMYRVLNYVSQNINDQYFPQVWSLPSLREKWIKIIAYFNRNKPTNIEGRSNA